MRDRSITNHAHIAGNGRPVPRLSRRFGWACSKMGRWAMMTFGKLTTFTAYLSLAFVGAIVLGLL